MLQEILTVVSEVDDIRQDCDTIHQVSISMLLLRHFDGGVLVEVTTSAMDCDSCNKVGSFLADGFSLLCSDAHMFNDGDVV
nr:hypothetical protein [Tanacetum cinerariifolium]